MTTNGTTTTLQNVEIYVVNNAYIYYFYLLQQRLNMIYKTPADIIRVKKEIRQVQYGTKRIIVFFSRKMIAVNTFAQRSTRREG